METRSAWLSLRQTFMHDLKSLDGDFIRGGVEAGSCPLGRPTVDKVPANLFFAGFVHEYDRAVLALGLAVDHGLAPVPQRVIVGGTPLENEIRVLVQAGQFAGDVALFRAFAVIDGVRTGIQTRAFSETVAADSIDLQFEVISTKRIFAVTSCHGSVSS